MNDSTDVPRRDISCLEVVMTIRCIKQSDAVPSRYIKQYDSCTQKHPACEVPVVTLTLLDLELAIGGVLVSGLSLNTSLLFWESSCDTLSPLLYGLLLHASKA